MTKSIASAKSLSYFLRIWHFSSQMTISAWKLALTFGAVSAVSAAIFADPSWLLQMTCEGWRNHHNWGAQYQHSTLQSSLYSSSNLHASANVANGPTPFLFPYFKKGNIFFCYHFVVNSRKCDPSSNGPILADGTEQGWGAWWCNAILALDPHEEDEGSENLGQLTQEAEFFWEPGSGKMFNFRWNKCSTNVPTTPAISKLHSKSWTCKNDARYHGNIAEATWRTANIESHGPWGEKLWWTYQVLNVSLWDELNPLK